MATITQWEILKTLTKRKQGTQDIRKSLAERDIYLTLRSIQRNLEKLSQTFPITSDHQNPAGWNWAENCDLLSLPAMDGSTALTLRLSEQYLTEMLPKGCINTLKLYMAHASKLLAEIEGAGVGEWPKRIARISHQQQLTLPKIGANVLDEVFQAVLEGKLLTIKYQNLKVEESAEMDLHPLGLVFDSGIIYLVATVWSYQDERQFALHRITDAKRLEQKAKRKEGFCLQQYIANNNFEFPTNTGKIRIKLKVNKWLTRHLEERRLSEDQIIIKQESGSIIEASVTDTAQLKWWLLSHGTKVEIIDPPELRTSIRETIVKLHKTYSQGGE